MAATELKRSRDDKENERRGAEIRANKATERLTSNSTLTVRDFQIIRTLKYTKICVLNTLS